MDGAAGFVTMILLLGTACLAFTVWALVDAAKRTDEEFAAVGHQRMLWLVLLGVGALTQFGVVVAIAYLIAVRPRLRVSKPSP